MLSMLLPAPLIGVATFCAMLAWLLMITVLLVPGIVLKTVFAFVLRLAPASRLATRYLTGVADLWVIGNALIYRAIQDLRWQVRFDGVVEPGKSYLLICNHQSWADILVLCDALRGRNHFPRFFLKRELIWVPIIGVTCWALDMPFMKRHSREAIARNPALRGDDLRTTRAFCEKYRRQPITAIMFPEGTRFTPAKRAQQDVAYAHLLRPKSAGLAFTLNAMSDQFAGIIDVTIAYKPTGGASLVWSWLCGRQQTLVVEAAVKSIPNTVINGDHDGDPVYRAAFQAWLNELWAHKDARLSQLKTRAISGPTAAETAASSH